MHEHLRERSGKKLEEQSVQKIATRLMNAQDKFIGHDKQGLPLKNVFRIELKTFLENQYVKAINNADRKSPREKHLFKNCRSWV